MNRDKLIDFCAKCVALCIIPFYKLYKKIKGFTCRNVSGKNMKNKSKKIENTKIYSLKKKDKTAEIKEKVKAFLISKNVLSKRNIQMAVAVLVLAIVVVGVGINYNNTIKQAEMQALIEQNKPLNLDELTQEDRELILGVRKFIHPTIFGYAISVNNNEISFFENKKQANEVLSLIKESYLEKDVEYAEVFFNERVEVIPAIRDITSGIEYDTVDDAIYFISKGSDEKKSHEVKKGENFWIIAQRYNVGVDDLIKANPKVAPRALQIGETISLIVPKPFISVSTVRLAKYEESIPFDIVYEDNANLYKGEFRTKVDGVYGHREVDAKIYYKNGVEIGRVVLSEKISSNPSKKVVYRGTKNPPPRKGTGVFAKPITRGYVTSEFGWRWGRRHNGIDIGIPTGTPVTAADGGVVVFAGTKGGYGKCVIIDHGANLETRYAHNSKLYVKTGDKVFKGQTISASGNTGVSTGPHLHFEIRKNNVPVNPRGYLSF